MRAVLQRVSQASVTVDGQVIGEIGKGVMVLFGMLGTDDDKTIEYMLDKVVNLRIFEDAMTFKIATMVMNYLHTERNQ